LLVINQLGCCKIKIENEFFCVKLYLIKIIIMFKESFRLGLKRIVFFLIISFLISSFFSLAPVVGVAAEEGGGDGASYKFHLLENYGKYQGDIADIESKVGAGDSSGALASYINFIVKLSFGLGSIAAVALII
jgi:hypothetical protein